MKKLVNLKYIEMSSDEITVRKSEKMPEPEPTQEERLAELEAQNQMLTQCLMEMSQIVYA